MIENIESKHAQESELDWKKTSLAMVAVGVLGLITLPNLDLSMLSGAVAGTGVIMYGFHHLRKRNLSGQKS